MLEESTILGYLQIIVAVFIFGVGLPTLLSDLPELERKIRDRHAKYASIDEIPGLFTIFFLGSIFILIGYLFDLSPFISCNVPISSSSQNFCLFRSWARQYSDYIINLVTISNLIIVMLFWHRLRAYRRESIVDFLCKKCVKDLSRSIESDECIKDLAELGKYSIPGRDKERVLEKLSLLAESVSAGNDSSVKIMEVIEQTTYQGTVENYITSIEIFNKILPSLPDQKLDTALSILERIGIQAFKLDARRVERVLLESVSTRFTVNELITIRTLFSWYKVSMEKKRYAFALGILDKTSRLVLDFIKNTKLLEQNDEFIETVGVYLGMLAYSYDSSTSAKDLVVQRLKVLKEDFPNVITSIGKAKKHFTYNEADFVTADMLERLYEGIK